MINQKQNKNVLAKKEIMWQINEICYGHNESNVDDSTAALKLGVYGASKLSANELITVHFSHHDLKRIELYARNMVDHHMIADTLSTLARLLFLGRLPDVRLSNLQVAVLIAIM